MAGRKGKAAEQERERVVPEFDITLWGYDREQVERCIEDLTARLEQAFGQLDTVEVLQAELCEAHVELDQLRMTAEDRPTMANHLSKIMVAAELLRNQAAQDAEAIRARARGEVVGVVQRASTT